PRKEWHLTRAPPPGDSRRLDDPWPFTPNQPRITHLRFFLVLTRQLILAALNFASAASHSSLLTFLSTGTTGERHMSRASASEIPLISISTSTAASFFDFRLRPEITRP